MGCRRRAGPTFVAMAALALVVTGPGCQGPGVPDAARTAVCPDVETLAPIRALVTGRQYADAEEQARRMLEEAELGAPGDSIEKACLLDLLVESLWRNGRAGADDAGDLAARAVAMKTALLGEVHTEVAASLRNQGQVFDESGSFDEARATYQRVLEMRRQLVGNEHRDVALALRDLGNLHLVTGRYEEARSFYEQGLVIQEALLRKAATPDDSRSAELDLATTLNNLGNLGYREGRYEEARGRLQRALEIYTRILGENDLELTWTLDVLATLSWAEADFDDACNLYGRALEIRRERLPENAVQIAWSLQNLGNGLRDAGRFREARERYEEALGIYEARGEQDSLHLAKTEHNFGQLLTRTGDFTTARVLFDKALVIRRASGEAGAIDTGNTLEWLGILAATRGDRARLEGHDGEARTFHAEALASLREAVAIYRRDLGERDWNYALGLGLMARSLLALDRVDESREKLEEALGIEREIWPEPHPWKARTLVALGDLHLHEGSLERAKALYAEALENYLGAHMPDHPETGEAEAKMGLVLARTGSMDVALEHALRAEEIGRRHLTETMSTMSEASALRYADVRESGMDLALSIAAASGDPAHVRRAWDALVRSRALVLDEMAGRRRWESLSDDPEIGRLQADLLAARRRRAHLVTSVSDRPSLGKLAGLHAEALRAEQAAEAALARRSAAYRRDLSRQAAGLDEVIEGLPGGAGLVGFVRFHREDLGAGAAVGTAGSRGEPGASYAAFVLRPGPDTPEMVVLGEASGIESLVRAWVAAVGSPPTDDAAAGSGENIREAGQRLREKVWDPVASSLDGAGFAILVPDGALHAISFAALPTKEGRYLLETGPLLHYLSAERDIAGSPAAMRTGHGLLALGGPDFDSGTCTGNAPAGGAPHPDAAARHATRSPPPGALPACPAFEDLVFTDLSEAAAEAEDIESIWGEAGAEEPVTRHSACAATEASFKAEAPGKRILHLSTHGFFLGDHCVPAAEGIRGITQVAPANRRLVPRMGRDSPLLMSGLALAGANRRGDTGRGEEDGILTASEIAAMDLGGVEWAVLSACKTGVGSVQAGEGVLGLRRAFEVAGARTVIMTLWSVSEVETREWMDELYRGRLLEGLSTAEAVRQAGLRFLAKRRRLGLDDSPFFWGAFVAAGDWR